MTFGAVPVAQAVGAILAHSVKLPGGALKKGRVLGEAEVNALREAGLASVVVARLRPDDVGENDAALLLARSICGPELSCGAPLTGRVNLYAQRAGLLQLEVERVDQLNQVDEAVTLATLPQLARVQKGQLVATVKVIPFSVPRSVLQRCQAVAAGTPVARVAPFRARRAALIQTRFDQTKQSLLDAMVGVMASRLKGVGAELSEQRVCPHSTAELSHQLEQLAATGTELVLISGASANADRRDVVPAAIESAGGRVHQVGIPVDPGNLLVWGQLGGTLVIGLPGCARSPATNGVDLFLERILADLPPDRAAIARMGVGGLLKEAAGRPMPRLTADARRIGALILAGGLSRRFHPRHKLLVELDGVPMVARVAKAVLESGLHPVWVVTGHQHEEVQRALTGLELQFVHNPAYAEGISSSLRRGLQALPAEVDAVAVCLGDMPQLEAKHLTRLAAAFDPVEGRTICVPTFEGKRGNPVLWSRRYFAEMEAVVGDVGARHLIGEHADQVFEVEMGDAAVLLDIDSPAELEAWKAGEGLVYHLALASELAAGFADGFYRPSRLPLDGFVHCAGDLPTALEVARSYFLTAAEPVHLLEISLGRLTSPCRFEAPAPLEGGSGHRSSGKLFPHVYGPIDETALRDLGPLVRRGDHFHLPGPSASAGPT